jgi:hypothetical protein
MSKVISRPRVVGAVAICFVGLSGIGVGFALADQPFMHDALASLESARGSLQSAEANKGGHRVKAIADVDAAIYEVRAGIAFAQ